MSGAGPAGGGSGDESAEDATRAALLAAGLGAGGEPGRPEAESRRIAPAVVPASGLTTEGEARAPIDTDYTRLEPHLVYLFPFKKTKKNLLKIR